MNETDVRQIIERLFVHVSALPWSDTVYMRSDAMKQAARDHIVELTVQEIMGLNKEQENAQKEND